MNLAMNPWYELFLYLFLFAFIIISGIISVVLIIRNRIKHRRIKPNVIFLGICCVLLAALTLFIASHPTYYKYNDWTILNSSIYEVQEKYGDFDIGKIQPMKAGKVAYYIYTDEGPIMPDHLKHYYYMEYDVWGVVYNVYDECQPGG